MMKISKKEKYLLLGLGAVAIGLGYYFFVFDVQRQKISKLESERNTVQSDYDAKSKRIDNLNIITTNNKKMLGELTTQAKDFYPDIIQEKIILELDKFMQDKGVSGDLSFKEKEVTTVEKIGAPAISESNGALGKLADQINDKSAEATYKSPSTGKTTVDCEQLKVTLKFKNTTYKSLYNFISALQNYERKIAINKLESKSNGTNLEGTIELEFYGVAPLSDTANDYLKWTITNVYGKAELFSTGAATGVVAQNATTDNVNDFAMILRAPNSDFPLLTLGKYKDSSRQSYIYSDKEDKEDVAMEFTEEKGELFYKYRTSTDYYPKDNKGIGEKFTPLSNDINIEISSELRMGDTDKSGVNLKIVNHTSKRINVIVKNDDKDNPRVKVVSEGNSSANVTLK